MQIVIYFTVLCSTMQNCHIFHCKLYIYTDVSMRNCQCWLAAQQQSCFCILWSVMVCGLCQHILHTKITKQAGPRSS